jgi:hypothetical protein
MSNALNSSPQGFAVHAFGSNIRVDADSAEAYGILDRYVFPSLERNHDAVEPDLSLRLVRCGEDFRLLVNGSEAASARLAIDLVAHFVHALDEAIVGRLTALKAVHAGVVQWDGKAMVLPGSTHSGKSALVSELLRRGATYLSDEFALVDTEGRVHAYPRPLLLRDHEGRQVPVLAEECGARVADAPAQIRWILALEYDPGANWKIEEVPQSVALLSLLRNTPHAVADSPEMLIAFERAVAHASCFAGSRGDAAAGADRILELIAAGS